MVVSISTLPENLYFHFLKKTANLQVFHLIGNMHAVMFMHLFLSILKLELGANIVNIVCSIKIWKVSLDQVLVPAPLMEPCTCMKAALLTLMLHLAPCQLHPCSAWLLIADIISQLLDLQPLSFRLCCFSWDKVLYLLSKSIQFSMRPCNHNLALLTFSPKRFRQKTLL